MINIIVNQALIFLSNQLESLFNDIKNFEDWELYKSFSSFDYVQEVMIPWTLALSLISC